MKLIKGKEKSEYLAVDGEKIVGKGYVYESLSSEIYEEVRTNFFIDTEADDDDIRRWLVGELVEVGKKRRDPSMKARVYHCCFSDDQESIDFYASVPQFVHDEGMHVLKCDLKSESCDRTGIVFDNLKDDEAIEMFIKEHSKIFSGHPYSLEKMKALKEENDLMSLGAYENDLLIGNVLMMKDEGQWWIEDLFVSKHQRKKGIAKQLMKNAHQCLLDKGITEARLEVWSKNKRAVSLYQSLGYMLEKETEVSIGVNI